MPHSTKKIPKRRGADATKTRSKIIKAAQKLFVAKGFNGTSMREIAAQAKVTQSLLHHHFGNKQTLWQMVKHELTNQYFDEIARQIEHPQHSGKRDDLKHTIENRFRFIQNNPDIVRIALWQQLDKYTTNTTTRGRDLLRHLIEGLKEAQTEGKIRNDISPGMTTVLIFVLTTGWFQQNYEWILAQDDTPPKNTKDAAEDYLEAIQKLLHQGLTSKE